MAQIIEYKKSTTYDYIGNPVSRFGQAHQCGGVKLPRYQLYMNIIRKEWPL